MTIHRPRPAAKVGKFGGLDPAIAGFLVDGDRHVAIEDLRGRGQGILVLWLKDELRQLWQKHRAELEVEAVRRRIRPWWPTFDRPRRVE